MAFPWVFQENLESGDKGNFAGTSVDGGGALSFPHWRSLAGIPAAPMPFRGAYAARVELANVDGSGTYLLETSAFDHTGDVTRYLRFYFFASTDLVMAASDVFDIFTLRSASANEVTISVRNNSGVIEIGAGETAGTTRTSRLHLGVWHSVELALAYDGAADGSGTIDFYLDDYQVGAQITGLTQAASTEARFGCANIDSGTTAGSVYFDQIIYDDTSRVRPIEERKPREIIITDDEHIFVGPGVVSSATLLSTGASNTMHLYDTDTARVADAQAIVIEADLGAYGAYEGPFYFHKGCYVQLNGTNPYGQVVIDLEGRYPCSPGVYVYQSDGAMRSMAYR